MKYYPDEGQGEKGRWNHIDIPESTFFNGINRQLQDFAIRYPCLPDLRDSNALLISSDYSESNAGQKYSIYSFLITEPQSWARFETNRILWRKRYLPDGRRLSYKKLNDKNRMAALNDFFIMINGLNGLSFSIAIEKALNNLIPKNCPLDISNSDFQEFISWKPHVFGKAYFLVNWLALLIAGLASPGQDIFWFTDEDPIAANNERIKQLTKLAGVVASHYLSICLGRFRCGTTKCDDGSRQIEDLCSIPDIIAGALAEQFSYDPLQLPCCESRIFLFKGGPFSDKTQLINWWLSDARHPLKRLVCIVNKNAPGISVSWLHFYNQT